MSAPVDPALVEDAHASAARVAELEGRLDAARDEYRRAVRRLHLAGASMREVAEALGLSHQRVHQLLEGGIRRWRRRRRGVTSVPASCSFCGTEQRQVRKLVAGPAARICDPCIMAAVGVAASGRSRSDPALAIVASRRAISCAFCRKQRAEVRTLVAASGVDLDAPPAICDECLGLCGEILSTELRRPAGRAAARPR